VKQGASTTTTYFQYGEQGLLSETDQTGKITKAYGFNPKAAQDGLWSTDPIWQTDASNGGLTNASSSYSYLHTDRLRTPILATDNHGSLTWQAVTEAFGAAEVLPATTITMNLRFPGQYLDQETGIHYNFQRDYKPPLGRYIQSDPIRLRGGNNLFAYASQQPINEADSFGLVNWNVKSLGGGKGIGESFGFSIDILEFTSGCVNNRKCTVRTIILMSGPAAGSPFSAYIDTIGSTYVDGYDTPTPAAIAGLSLKIGCELYTSTQYIRLMLIKVGETTIASNFAVGRNPNIHPDLSFSIGYGGGCQIFAGTSVPFFSKCEECCQR
jgi:RHS repeat-associated protein